MACTGTICLKIIAARDLVGREGKGMANPFCEVQVGPAGPRHRTESQPRTRSPEWTNGDFTVHLTEPLQQEGVTVTVTVWDNIKYGDDQFLGCCALTFNPDSPNECQDWFPLHPRERHQRDDLKFLAERRRLDFGRINISWKFEFHLVDNALLLALQKRAALAAAAPQLQLESGDECSFTQLKENLSLLSDFVDVLEQPILLVEEWVRWRRPVHSLLALILILAVCYFDLLLSGALACLAALLVRNYVLRLTSVSAGSEPSFDLVDVPKATFRGATAMVGKYNKAEVSAYKAQLKTARLLHLLDEMTKIVTWHPEKRGTTTLALRALLIGAATLLFIPLPPMRYPLALVSLLLFTGVPLQLYFPALLEPRNVRAAANRVVATLRALAKHIPQLPIKTGQGGPAQRQSSPTVALVTQGSSAPTISPAGTTIWYACCIRIQLRDEATEFIQHLSALLAVGPLRDTNARLELLVGLIKHLASADKYFLVPPPMNREQIQPDGRVLGTGRRAATLAHLDFSCPLTREQLGQSPSAQSVDSSGILALLNSAVLVPVHKANQQLGEKETVRDLAFLANALFQPSDSLASPLFFLAGTRIHVLFRVYGQLGNPVEQFEPSRCSSTTCPESILRLLPACCRPDPSERPTLRQCAAIFEGIRSTERHAAKNPASEQGLSDTSESSDTIAPTLPPMEKRREKDSKKKSSGRKKLAKFLHL